MAGTKRLPGARRNVTQIGRIEPPLAAAIHEAHRIARDQIRRSEKLHDLFFREMPEYPEFSWQEAMVNAFAHRDYENQSREIEVWFFDDRMEVTSPGEPIPPVTLDLLRQRRPVHASRNPLLVRVLVEAGLMREEGEGIPRMFDEMESSYLHVPEFGIDASAFTVTLRNEPIFSGPGREWQEMVGRLQLHVPQQRILLARPEGFTNEDYRSLNGVDRDQAYREIQEMVAAGAIAPAESPGRGAVYRVAPRLMEARSFLQGRVPALRKFLETHPYVTNADYRKLFEVSRETAKRELSRLVEEQYLELRGERRASRYQPGQQMRTTTR